MMKSKRTFFSPFGSEIQRYALTGALFGFLFPIGATLLRMQLEGLSLTWPNAASVQRNDPLLWIIDTAPLFLGVFAAFAGRRQDNLQQLNENLRQQSMELESTRQTLEQRVDERTADLTKRASQLQAIATAARAIAGIQDLSSLLSDISTS